MKVNKQSIMEKFGSYLSTLNNSKFFAGLVMIMLNIGSKYVTIELSKSQEEYLRNSIGRQLLIFAISWMGSRDIIIALVLTAVFNVLANHLFNEESNYCIIPKGYRNFKHLLDENGDGIITEEEIQKALEILNKAKKQKRSEENLKYLNYFNTSL